MRASIAFIASLLVMATASPLALEKRTITCPAHALAGSSPNNIPAESWYLQRSSVSSTVIDCYYNYVTDGTPGNYIWCEYDLTTGKCEKGWCGSFCESNGVSA